MEKGDGQHDRVRKSQSRGAGEVKKIETAVKE
jgi:hypothetical protein